MKHRILLQTNPTWIKTGLSENCRTLMRYLWKTQKFDLAQLCTQSTMMNDPRLALSPWKCYGSIPADQDIINRINGDGVFARDASYGALGIEPAVKDWKPTIWIGADDVWSFPLAQHSDAPWYKRVHPLHHITIDSLPVIDQAFEQAKRSKNYLTWARFGAKAMKEEGKRRGMDMSHVSSIYGAMDTNFFSPIDDKTKADLRAQFKIPPDMFIFLFVGRNQLRKSMNSVLEAFARFKIENPGVKAGVLLHTSFSEKGQGWDLPKMAQYYGVKPDELLCTYVCKSCGAWLIAPYQGEDLRCPSCGTDKALVTANIINGVPGNHMKLIYGFIDACLNPVTSGGFEMHSSQSLLCGKPLALNPYSCGEDFCLPGVTDTFVTPLKWHPYHEPGTNFIKATTDVGSLASFMRRMVRSPKRDLQEAGERGRAWAVDTFGIATIGKQWEDLFAKLDPNVDWSSIEVATVERKDPTYQPPGNLTDNAAWLKDIYKGILKMDVSDSDGGLRDWLNGLAAGQTREAILAYFKSVAESENTKLGSGTVAAPAQDLWSLINKTTGKKRCIFVIKESRGDCLLCTQLFESFHEKYSNYDLYVMTSPQYNDVFEGDPHVFRILPWIPAGDHEMAMCGAGQKEGYFHLYLGPGALTQKHLGYLYS